MVRIFAPLLLSTISSACFAQHPGQLATQAAVQAAVQAGHQATQAAVQAAVQQARTNAARRTTRPSHAASIRPLRKGNYRIVYLGWNSGTL